MQIIYMLRIHFLHLKTILKELNFKILLKTNTVTKDSIFLNN